MHCALCIIIMQGPADAHRVRVHGVRNAVDEAIEERDGRRRREGLAKMGKMDKEADPGMGIDETLEEQGLCGP